jgi:hypothetical protein
MEKKEAMRKTMLRAYSSSKNVSSSSRLLTAAAICLILCFAAAPEAKAQAATNPLSIFQNYFVTGDYVVSGWVEGAPDGSGFTSGTISFPDTRQPNVPTTIPKGADIVAAYLYWGTVEKSKSAAAGKQAFFNGYAITGTPLGKPGAPPVSWSSGGCSGSANGTTAMQTYRADVRPYLPLDSDAATLGAIKVDKPGGITVRLADSGSNGNTAPFALGASLVVIYRVLNPPTPLNAIVIYDGDYAPSNAGLTTSQNITGFYQASNSSLPVAKLTQIVGNGQSNKSEQVYFSGLQPLSHPLASIYGSSPPFPGIYGSWDNPTWVLSPGYVNANDSTESVSIVPTSSNSGCVSWGAMILSTTVQDTDGDGLLDVWEDNQGYTDAVGGQQISLPGANRDVKDLFVEIDYLANRNGDGSVQHSHLPKKQALDAVGAALAPPDSAGSHAHEKVNVHFDVGNNYQGQGDPYIIEGGTGGNEISEAALICSDPNPKTPICAFPGQPAVGWKGSFSFVRDTAFVPNSNPAAPLGNFQPGRAQSYHYILFGHSLGSPRSFWSTLANGLAANDLPQLVSIANSGSFATITLKTPSGVVKPGDCPGADGCGDGNSNRVTISGAAGQPNLNGTYTLPNTITKVDANTIKFTIATSNVADNTYQFSNEPQLGVSYLGPTSTSGHSDFGGGGDSVITLGLWGFDDPLGCISDPGQSLTGTQVYCNNQTGTADVQTGTLLHELGHSLGLTHGGTYYSDVNPSLPIYEVNCKPNFVSVMNYLFQVRGFVDGGFDYSNQMLSPLNETSLNESTGIGTSNHLTRWYSNPNALDNKLQSATQSRYAKQHCDGTPLNGDPAEVRVDAGDFSGQLDWNNNLNVPDNVSPPGIDVDYNGSIGGSTFSGFDDWNNANLQQLSARAGAFGFSQAGGLKNGGGGLKNGGGGIDDDGGGLKNGGGGLKNGGGGLKNGGGGTDQDETTANSTASPPSAVACSNCVAGSPVVESGHSVPLTWSAPGYGQVRSYDVWRATGSFPSLANVLNSLSQFTKIKTLTGAPPLPSTSDSNVKNNTTYTYFVTDTNKQGAQSSPSNILVVRVKF